MRQVVFDVRTTAMSVYEKLVLEARGRLVAHIDVIGASKKSPAIDDMRKRIAANDWDEIRLTPEEDALVEGLYPDLHDKIGEDEHFVLEAERVQTVIEQTLRPVDI